MKVRLEVQPFQVLRLLLERQGGVVTREELKQALWPDDAFGDFDSGVNQAIRKIRRALDDSATEPRFVETLPRRGYRFVAPVELPAALTSSNGSEQLGWTEAPPVPAPEPVPRWKQAAPYVAVALASVATGLLLHHFVIGDSESSAPEIRLRRWSFELSDLRYTAGRWPLIQISPDGKHIAYVASDSRSLWVHDLAQVEPRRLDETEGVGRFAWSPDSKAIAFHTEGTIKRVAVPGGTTVTLSEDDSINPSGGILWNTAGDLVRFDDYEVRYEVPSRGGLAQESHLPKGPFLWEPRSPALQPDFLFVKGFYPHEREVMIWDSQTEKARFLVKGWDPWYSFGHILFASFGPPQGIWAMPFSTETRQVGDPFPIKEARTRFLSVSDDGTLVFAVNPVDEAELLLLNRKGEIRKVIGQPQDMMVRPEFSPDGRRVAVWGFDYENGPSIWVHEVDRPSKSRLTSNDSMDNQPVWSQDGTRIAFTSDREGYGGETQPKIRNLFTKSADSSKPATLLAQNSWVWDWSEDGAYVLTTLWRGENQWFDLGYLEIKGEGPYEAKPLRTTPHQEEQAQFSPDGRYVAFQSDDTGRPEVYICSFPDCEAERRVSLRGGMFPRWAKKQGSLYFREGTDNLMEVKITTQPELYVGTPRRLFSSPYLYMPGAVRSRHYDVMDDGRHFVVVRGGPARISKDNPAEIHVLQNWYAAFKDRELTAQH